MEILIEILESIPTKDCHNRLQAKDDLIYALSMNSKAVIENINHCWVDIDQEVIENLTQDDAQYRAFLVEFWETYNAN